MKKNLVWLASYPKSGNTWVRMFLANYLMDRSDPVSINDINKFGFGDANARIYQKLGGAGFDLRDPRKVLAVRDRVLRSIVSNGSDINFVKTHNANAPAFGTELIPPQYTRSAVYIVRNPLDVALSFARHFGCSLETAATNMGRSDFVTNMGEGRQQVTQYLGSWSDHVFSWTGRATIPVLVLRYEDMLREPADCFKALVQHIGLPVDAARMDKAVRHSHFDVLKQQEKDAGFVEKSPKAEAFFAKGQSEAWKTDLPPEIADQIRAKHAATMKKFRYLE